MTEQQQVSVIERSYPLQLVVAIGNSDDKLTQLQWFNYVTEIDDALNDWAPKRHGHWLTNPASPWQGASWWVVVESEDAYQKLRDDLAHFASEFQQDSVALLEGRSEMLAALAPRS